MVGNLPENVLVRWAGLVCSQASTNDSSEHDYTFYVAIIGGSLMGVIYRAVPPSGQLKGINILACSVR